MAHSRRELLGKLQQLAEREEGRPDQAAITSHLRDAEVIEVSRAFALAAERNGTPKGFRRHDMVVPPPPGWLPPLT
jgi:hypothetical protein